MHIYPYINLYNNQTRTRIGPKNLGAKGRNTANSTNVTKKYEHRNVKLSKTVLAQKCSEQQ